MAALIAALIALAGSVAPVHAAMRVVDDTGAAVALDAPARRIVALAPHATELVFAAGAGDRLVGVVAGSDFPADARRIPVVGDAHAVDVERIVALKPDLVVTWPYTVPAQAEQLRARGIALFVTDPRTIDGIAAALERVGALAGTEATARAAASAFRAKLAALRERERALARVRVFYEIWDSPLYTVGGRHLITQALDVCAADNVFASIATPAPSVSVEAVLAAAPDAVVAAFDDAVTPSWLDAWRRWPQLPATRHGNFATVDANLLHRPGPRFADGVEMLCKTIDGFRKKMGSS